MNISVEDLKPNMTNVMEPLKPSVFVIHPKFRITFFLLSKSLTDRPYRISFVAPSDEDS